MKTVPECGFEANTESEKTIPVRYIVVAPENSTVRAIFGSVWRISGEFNRKRSRFVHRIRKSLSSWIIYTISGTLLALP